MGKEKCSNMEFDLTNIKFSRVDIKRKLMLPRMMTKELSELIGVIIGDGHMEIYNSNGITHSALKFAGHKSEDFDYYNEYVNSLFKKLFNLELDIKCYNRPKGSYLVARVDSKGLLQFLSKVLKLPTGNKVSISKIPECISLLAEQLDFIRGLADTDFCITFKKKYKTYHYYPVISVTQKSKFMIEDLENLFRGLGFSFYVQYNVLDNDKRGFKTITHRIYISGTKNLSKWMDIIGFSNSKHLTKYLVWKRYGYCEPYTTLEQRKLLLTRTDPGGFEPPTIPAAV